MTYSAAKEILHMQNHPISPTSQDHPGNGDSQQHPPTSKAAAVSKVLDDDKLLMEIIVRVGFPTTLVCAALVCKRWYHHASDREFLTRFHKRHLPRLLGFYINGGFLSGFCGIPRFVPFLPQPPELAAIVRRVESHSFNAYNKNLRILECQNGSVFTVCYNGVSVKHVMHHPLCREIGTNVLPPFPNAPDPFQRIFDAILSKEEGGDLSYLYALAEWTMQTQTFKVHVYMLQGNVWCMHALLTDQLRHKLVDPKVVLVNNKIYIAACNIDNIIVLELIAASVSRIEFPQGVKYNTFDTIFSWSSDTSGVCLIHVCVKERQLRMWLDKGDNWLLASTISLIEMWDNLRMIDHTLEDEAIGFPCLSHVGDNAEYVFFKTMSGHAIYLDVTRKTLHKMDGITINDQRYCENIYPLMMIWPPIFPRLKDDLSRFAFWSLDDLHIALVEVS